ncbi:MAG: nucleotidyltransferase domain-containing protein [Pyrobaculum sp.]|jgi:predicted nucleotidyltransferase|uniref:nucleotidyltransferase domain-containing protein n=1 Tax=unclassified Pyrobaculum TaxID=2643434 RepID=UPI0021DA18AF|nr:nucleotidyltransferase domain-containing protein [Pyrobaculum sp. 3827-6]MCU7786812.1 nucleotidyltransferase domain-containing protein [Pyrobaculum sp. 3827-6]
MSEGLLEAARRNKSLTAEELAQAVEQALRGVEAAAAYLFGSAARGRFVRGLSDIDILVVTRGPPPWRGRTAHVEAGDVNAVYMSLEEACAAYRRGNNLVREALDEGILLAGEPVNCG